MVLTQPALIRGAYWRQRAGALTSLDLQQGLRQTFSALRRDAYLRGMVVTVVGIDT